MKLSLHTFLKHLTYSLIMLLIIMVQCVFFDRIEILGARPQVLLLYVLAVSFFESAKAGALYGLAGGYILDIVCGGGLYFSAVVYMLICYIAAYAVELYFTDGFLPYLSAAAVFLAAKHILDTFVILANYKNSNLLSVIWKIFLPEFVYTLVIAAAVYFPTMLLCSKFNKSGIS